MKKTLKSFYKVLICLVVLCLSAVALFNYIVDPFYNYHRPYEGIVMVSYGAMYQNLGEAKNFEYDTLITGTSMTENFRVSWFDDAFQCNAVKLPFQGGNIGDFDNLFKTVFSSGNDVKRVFYGVDLYTLLTEPGSYRFEYEDYQLSDNPIYDVQYLLSNEVLLKYSLRTFYMSYFTDYTYDADNAYVTDTINTYSKETLLADYERPEKTETSNNNIEDVLALCKENLSKLIRYIEDHPETEFYLFFPPYSILYWDTAARNGTYNSWMGAYEKAMNELVSHSNVKLFSFISDESIITNLENYKDYTHYSGNISHYLLECFVSGKDRVTNDNKDEIIKQFKTLTANYDYDGIFK